MRTTFHVFVNTADIEPKEIRDLLGDADVKAEKITKPGELGVYSVTIADDPLAADRLQDLLKRNGVDSFMRQSREVSAEVVGAAPLVAIRVEREHGYGGPTYGTEFSLDDACPECGTGARPVGDVILKASDVPKRGDTFMTLDGEFFVSDRLRERFEDEGFTGVEFHDVRAARSGDPLPWSRLLSSHTLPQVNAETTGGLRREDPCPVCNRDGYYGTAKSPLELHYSLTADELEELPDLSYTWEHFGKSVRREPFTESKFAQPLLIASPRVVETLPGLKIRGLLFDPVHIDT
jgi:hypothetical protein